MSKIIWIDEDERIWAPERKILLGLGTAVESIGDATSALSILSLDKIECASLLILDVMLLQGDDTNIFSNSETRMGRCTGLILARQLINRSPGCGRKILFFSRETEQAYISQIEAMAGEIGAYYLRKGPKTQGMEFINWLFQKKFIIDPRLLEK